MIECFNEMVRSGVKALALSHPMDSAAERDALIPFARSCCHQYGNQLYIEDTPLLTDTLSPLAESGQVQHPVLPGWPHSRPVPAPEGRQGQSGGRAGLLRRQPQAQLAWEYGRLLSYPDEAIRRLISDNPEEDVSESLRGRRLPPPSLLSS